MDIKIDFANQKQMMMDFQDQSVEVGILDHSTKAKKPDRKGSLKSFLGQRASKIKRGRAGNSKVTLHELALILDDQYGFFTDAEKKARNRDLKALMNEFAKYLDKGYLTRIEKLEIERSARALVRNPILRGDYGSNAKSTRKAKRFDWPGVDTGTFFNNIRARYRGR